MQCNVIYKISSSLIGSGYKKRYYYAFNTKNEKKTHSLNGPQFNQCISIT